MCKTMATTCKTMATTCRTMATTCRSCYKTVIDSLWMLISKMHPMWKGLRVTIWKLFHDTHYHSRTPETLTFGDTHYHCWTPETLMFDDTQYQCWTPETPTFDDLNISVEHLRHQRSKTSISVLNTWDTNIWWHSIPVLNTWDTDIW